MTLKRREIDLEEAKERTARHRQDFLGIRKSWVRLGREVAESVDLRVPAKLGMNMRDWMAQTFEDGKTKIFRELQSYRALAGVPEKQLEAIAEGNAHELTRLPEVERKSPEWVEKAVDMPAAEFREAVTVALEKKGVPREEMRTFAVIVSKSIYDEMQAAERKIAKMCSLDIEAKPGLRMICWSNIASLVNTTEESHLVIEMEGKE
jgi:hypothetical protein